MPGGDRALHRCVSHACAQANRAAAGGLEVETSASRVSLGTGTQPFVRPYIHATAGPTFVSALPSAYRRGPVRACAGAEDQGETTRAAETRPRSAGERRGAPVPRPGCLPHLANDVFKTILPRQCPLGVGGYREGAQGQPGTSWLRRAGGGQGNTSLPKSQIALREAGILPPHPKSGARNSEVAS